jgi:hypothetical protein
MDFFLDQINEVLQVENNISLEEYQRKVTFNENIQEKTLSTNGLSFSEQHEVSGEIMESISFGLDGIDESFERISMKRDLDGFGSNSTLNEIPKQSKESIQLSYMEPDLNSDSASAAINRDRLFSADPPSSLFDNSALLHPSNLTSSGSMAGHEVTPDLNNNVPSYVRSVDRVQRLTRSLTFDDLATPKAAKTRVLENDPFVDQTVTVKASRTDFNFHLKSPISNPFRGFMNESSSSDSVKSPKTENLAGKDDGQENHENASEISASSGKEETFPNPFEFSSRVEDQGGSLVCDDFMILKESMSG